MDHFTKYYGALRAIEIRFPVSSDSSHVNISFKWHDAFRDKQTCTQKNIHFEKASVLFCMAAIASQKGLDVSRKTESGITEAVKSFALAAGARILQLEMQFSTVKISSDVHHFQYLVIVNRSCALHKSCHGSA
jgi:hypothetical protein